ncbi:hypothetical protein RGQ29_033127 [Quercus rubra]|uniref:NADH-quinone oxidoreductase subunit D domain-containing protein n=1 Tax=Quercus rubra TaxID=3512 RepID=A0AAN7DW99_QUERU|nr:hypothetical protein RGQ29_033127 [Quercus rubra]
MLELSRIASSFVMARPFMADIGAQTPFFYIFRERELVYDLFEAATGMRMMHNYFRIGGVAADLPYGWIDKCLDFCDYFLTGDQCCERSGIQWDLRKIDHYECYDEFDWEVQWQKEGDSLARAGRNSGGPYENLEIRYFDRKRYPEWHDFEYRFISKKPSPTFELPKQELYVRVEAPKGELGIFLIGDQSGFPWRWKIRPPGFINLQILPQLVKRMKLADIMTILVQDINSFYRVESLKGVYGIIWVLVPILTLVLGITIGVLVIVWLEREISAGLQQRIGPEYSGPLGVLQALADGTKLLFKENLLPSRGDTRYSVIPFDYHLVLADLNIGVFLWIAVSSIAPIGLLISGYGSNNKYSFLGGLRAAAQSISYEIPLTLCVLAISLRAIR